MNYLYDLYGWYVGTSDTAVQRSTPTPPDNLSLDDTPGQPRANWTGYVWLDQPYVVPVFDPPPITPLQAAQAEVRERVAAERGRRERLGVPYTFPGQTSGTVQTRDDTDTRNIQGVVTTAMILQAQGVTGPVLTFRDDGNTNHSLTPAEAIAMGMAVSSHVNDLYSAKWAHDAAINELADVTACAAYDIEAGWPE